MSFFDLVEEHNAILAAAYGLCQLSAFVVAYVTGRRADETTDRVFLLVLAHVDADHRMLVIKEELCQGARQLGLTNAGRAQEDERADRAVGVLQPGASAAHRVRYHTYRIVLPDHAIVQTFFHAQQFLSLAFEKLRNRDTRPAGDNRRDLLSIYFFLKQRILRLHGFQAFFRGANLLFQLALFAVA